MWHVNPDPETSALVN